MKRLFNFCTISENFEFEKADSIEINIKDANTIRNIDNLTFSNKTYGMFDKVDSNEDIISLIQNFISQNYGLLQEAKSITFFRNKYSNQHDYTIDKTFNDNTICIYKDDADPRDVYMKTLIDKAKILIYDEASKAYKLSQIDFLLFVKNKIDSKYKSGLKEELKENDKVRELLKVEIKGLTDIEYNLILERLEVLRTALIIAKHLNDEESTVKQFEDLIDIYNEKEENVLNEGELTYILDLVKTRY